MKSLLRPLLAGGLATATAVVLTSGCVDNRASIYIAGVMIKQPPQCNVTNDPSAPQRLRGTLDLAVKAAYDAVLLVGNQLTPRGEKIQGKAEPMRIALSAAEITLLDGAGEQLSCPGNEECGSFSIFGAGVASVNRSEDAAFGLFSAQLIPPIVTDSIFDDVLNNGAVTIVASVKVRGETLGGREIESGEFIFPVDVCYGCLIKYNNGQCCLRTPGESVPEACDLGQDRGVDCRACFVDVCDSTGPGARCGT